MRKHFLWPHGDFPGCSVVLLEQDKWTWSLPEWWRLCHREGNTKVVPFINRAEGRLLEIQAKLYPAAKDTSERQSIFQTTPLSAPCAYIDSRGFVSFMCWCLGGYRQGRERPREWTNRLMAGKRVRGLLHMLLQNMNRDVQFHLWWMDNGNHACIGAEC